MNEYGGWGMRDEKKENEATKIHKFSNSQKKTIEKKYETTNNKTNRNGHINVSCMKIVLDFLLFFHLLF